MANALLIVRPWFPSPALGDLRYHSPIQDVGGSGNQLPSVSHAGPLCSSMERQREQKVMWGHVIKEKSLGIRQRKMNVRGGRVPIAFLWAWRTLPKRHPLVVGSLAKLPNAAPIGPREHPPA